MLKNQKVSLLIVKKSLKHKQKQKAQSTKIKKKHKIYKRMNNKTIKNRVGANSKKLVEYYSQSVSQPVSQPK